MSQTSVAKNIQNKIQNYNRINNKHKERKIEKYMKNNDTKLYGRQ